MKLYLASSSIGRQNLLKESGIPFQIINHTFDEIVYDNNLRNNIVHYTLFVAKEKLNNIIFPKPEYTNEIIAILSADTMNQTDDGKIIGKAENLDEVRLFMKRASNTFSIITTSYVLNTYQSKKESWIPLESYKNSVSAKIWCYMDDQDIHSYIEAIKEKTLLCSGGFSITGMGAQFIVKIEGSYSTIVGLPLSEVRKDLKKIGFFN